MERTVTFRLDGVQTEVRVQPNDLLLDTLRDKLGVKSPKYGCGRGECGACAVLIDGRSVRSCLVLAVEVEGASVQTLEGLPPEVLEPLQEAFLSRNAFQCGFCAPGVTVTACELLSSGDPVDREAVTEALSGNLCRCTGYTPIVDAVLDAAAALEAKR